MTSKKRSHRLDKLARIYDAEILPVWSRPFGPMILRELEIPERSQILSTATCTGYPAVEILHRMSGDGRLIAIDGSSALLDVARKKIEELDKKGVFFRTESMEPRLSFADDVYDLVVCNLGLSLVEDRQQVLCEFARVTKPGGRVRATLPIHGTFQEFYDIYREVLTKHDKHDTLARLSEHMAESYPDPTDCERWLKIAGLGDVEVEIEEFSMLFRSSREFFFAPVIEYGPLTAWKRVAGRGQEMQDVFWYIKEAIDAYFEGRAFEITVKAACLKGIKPVVSDEEEETGRVLLIDDIEEISAPGAADDELLTDEIDLDEMVETIDGDSPVIEEYSIDEVPIDAFTDGVERPEHLEDPMHEITGDTTDTDPDD